MMKHTIKKAILSCTVVTALLLPTLLWAQTPVAENAASNPLLSLYSDYAQAQYAVQWKVPTGDLSELRAKMPRYSYLLLYTSDDLLAATRGPFVQFGFFKNAREAQQFVQDNQAAFPGLKAVRTTEAEHAALMQQTAESGAQSPSSNSARGFYWLNAGASNTPASVKPVLAEAKVLYINRQYGRALEYYSALSLSSDPDVATWARELKGLTQESLGLTAQAEQTYQQLLASSNGSEPWAARVTQRLRGLETAADDGKSALRKSKYNDKQVPYYYRGVFGQSYNYVTSGGKNIADHDVLSVIATNIDATAGYRLPDHEFKVRLTGYSNYDLMDYPDDYQWGSDDRTVIKRAQLEYTHVDTGINAVGGRQKDTDSGMYMYFDGLTVKYPINNKITIGVNAGVPVQFSDFYDSLDRKFYSAQASYDHNEHWRVAAYITHQTLFDEIDRAAWGGRLQYVNDRFSSYLNLDYDYEFAELNIFRWSGTYRFDQKQQLTATYGMQRLPFLTSTNILLGQPYLNVEGYLRDQYNSEYLQWEALQRTGVYEYGSLSYQYKFDDSLHITTDLYRSTSSELPIFEYNDEFFIESSVVEKGAEYEYTSVGIQAVALDFLGMNDTATLSFRHGDSTQASSNLIQFSERLRFWNNKIYVTPKLNVKYTQKKITDDSRSNIRGAVAVIYKPWRNVELRMEAGNETIKYLEQKNNLDQAYMYVGYQARF